MKIIVTGGVPQKNNSEAILMKEWLIKNGIAEDRIITENHSTDTVTNMVYSRPILVKNEIEDVIIVSSATHVRRGRILLDAASAVGNTPFNISTFAYMDKTTEEMSGTDTVELIYSGAIRALGECYISLVKIDDLVAYDEDMVGVNYWIPGVGQDRGLNVMSTESFSGGNSASVSSEADLSLQMSAEADWDPAVEIDVRNQANAYINTARNTTTANTIRDNLNSAFNLVPYRVDLLHVVANVYNINGTTNNVNDVLDAYNKILAITPNDSKALFYAAFWEHYRLNASNAGSASIKSATVKKHLDKLADVDPGRYDMIVDFLQFLEKNVETSVENLSYDLTQEELDFYNAPEQKGKVAVLTLGNALQSDSSFTDRMLGRLDLTKEIATKIPDAKIVVTGGVPRNGTNEGVEMKKYLMDSAINGVIEEDTSVGLPIDEDRIFTENHSTNTITNMVYSRPFLDESGIKYVILITDDLHIQRSACLLKAVAVINGSPYNIKTAPSVFAGPIEAINTIYGNALRGFSEFNYSGAY